MTTSKILNILAVSMAAIFFCSPLHADYPATVQRITDGDTIVDYSL